MQLSKENQTNVSINRKKYKNIILLFLFRYVNLFLKQQNVCCDPLCYLLKWQFSYFYSYFRSSDIRIAARKHPKLPKKCLSMFNKIKNKDILKHINLM